MMGKKLSPLVIANQYAQQAEKKSTPSPQSTPPPQGKISNIIIKLVIGFKLIPTQGQPYPGAIGAVHYGRWFSKALIKPNS